MRPFSALESAMFKHFSFLRKFKGCLTSPEVTQLRIMKKDCYF